LLSAEMTASMGKDPGEIYASITSQHAPSEYERIDAPASHDQKTILAKLSAHDIAATSLAGEPIKNIMTEAPGDKEPIGGVKVVSENGWFAARPSGTEEIYKIYAESFRGSDHLKLIQDEAQKIVLEALAHKQN